MNEKNIPTKKQDLQKNLELDRKRLLKLTPEKALETLAGHPYPVSLVQSMTEEDLYFLVHHVGPEDALPILAQASNEQWEYILDMEAWEQDHIHPHQMTQWLARLLKADPDRFTHWIANQKHEETALYLFRNIQLHIREYDEDPGEIENDYFSEDQTYYIRLLPYPKPHKKLQEERDSFVKDMLNRISVYDHALYRDFLLASNSMIPAETEEELFRQRNVRLAEKGLLPFDEAIGVYQPLKASDLARRSPKTDAFDGRIVDAFPFPIDPDQPGENDNLFARTLAQMNDKASIEKLQAEFAGLCNQIISADQLRIREKQALEKVVQKVSDYISIGLEKVASQAAEQAPYANANLIQCHLLADIFRVGYGCALSLKWQAEKWHGASWFHHAGLPLTFWGETFMGILGGLLIKKPLFYDNYAAGELYRDFATLEDVEKTRTQLNQVIAFDDLLSLMNVEIGPQQGEKLLTYENLLLTMWAHHYLNTGADPKSPSGLPMTHFRRLYGELWEGQTKPRNISEPMREIFLGWLADHSGLTDYNISERLAPALEQLFVKIEKELGEVAEADLDPRFITLFLLV